MHENHSNIELSNTAEKVFVPPSGREVFVRGSVRVRKKNVKTWGLFKSKFCNILFFTEKHSDLKYLSFDSPSFKLVLDVHTVITQCRIHYHFVKNEMFLWL